METLETATPSPKIHTYHCICSTLILGSPHPLTSLSTRAFPSTDGAIIVPLSDTTRQVHTVEDRKPIIIRKEDGFEKRMIVRCERCNVVVGYKLLLDGERMSGPELVYILPGGLVDTEEMVKGNSPGIPAWARENS